MSANWMNRGLPLLSVLSCVVGTLRGNQARDSAPLLRVGAGTVVGFVSPKGELQVLPKYEGTARAWTEGHLLVAIEIAGDFGATFVDGRGLPIIDAKLRKFDDVVMRSTPQFAAGWVGVFVDNGTQDGEPGVLFSDGTLERLTYGLSWYQEIVPVPSDGGVRFLDLRTRKVLSSERYEDARWWFEGGTAPVKAGGKWGAINVRGEWVVPPEHDSVVHHGFRDGMLLVHEGSRTGLARPDGSWVLALSEQQFGASKFGFVAFQRNRKWGMIRIADGVVVVAPEYDLAQKPGHQMAPFMRGEKWGLVGFDGKVLLPFEYSEIICFGDPERPHRWVATRGRTESALVDVDGTVLVPSEAQSFGASSQFSRYVVVHRPATGFGVFDTKERRLTVPFEFSDCAVLQGCEDRSARVRKQGGKKGLVRLTDGAILLPREHDAIDAWRGSLVARKQGQVALFDVEGRPVLSWEANATELPPGDKPLVNGVGRMVCAGKAGLISEDGRIVLACRYEDVGSFSEGLVPAKRDGLWGHVNTAGEWAVPPLYEDVGAFLDGFAAARKDGKVGLIDKEGKTKVPFQYADAGYVHGGRFPVAVEREGVVRWGIADLDGKVVLPVEYDCVEWVDLMPGTTRYHGKPGWQEF